MPSVPRNVFASEYRADFDVDYVLNSIKAVGNMPVLKVAAYIRVSTELMDQENSYFNQEQYFTQLIASNPAWKFAGIYSDYGLSGTGTTDRIGFCRLLRHCKEKKIDRILCKSISRFARNAADFSRTLLLLRTWDVTIYFEKENLDSADMQNEFILQVLGAYAQEESRSISSNVRDGIRMRMSQGNAPNFVIYGYRFTENKLQTENGYEYKEIVEVPEEADIVRFIYEKVAAGETFVKIARYLNAQGIPAPNSNYNKVRKSNSKKGQLNKELDTGWRTEHISNIVRNERYIGDVLTQKTYTSDYLTHKVKINRGELRQHYITDHHPAIIDRTLYDKVQLILEKKRKKRSTTVIRQKGPFAKRIICKECGRFYVFNVKDGKNKWHCPTVALKNGLDICHAEDVAEETIIYILCKAIFEDYGLNYTLTSGKNKRKEKEWRITGRYSKKKSDRLSCDMQNRLEQILNDDYVERDRSQYRAKLSEIDAELENYAAKLVRLENKERHSRKCKKKEIAPESETLTDLRKQRTAKGNEFEETTKKLNDLEEYWKELECDYELRTAALQWLKTLPMDKISLQSFLQGVTNQYFRAFVLDLTVCQEGKYIVRWFDNRCTLVDLKKYVEENVVND